MDPLHLKHNNDRTPKKKEYTAYPPVIPFEKAGKKELNKGDYLNLKYWTNPNDPKNLQQYKLPIPFFSNGLPEEWLEFWS